MISKTMRTRREELRMDIEPPDCRILHNNVAIVKTSARREGRASRGFAHALMTTAVDLALTA